VNIVASPPRLYDAPNTTVDLTFTSPAPAVTTTTFTVALPVTGVITAEVTRNVTQSSQFSQAYVIKSYDDLPLEVGTGRIADLVGSTTNVTIKHFEGDFAPTAALVDFDNGDGDPFYGTGGYFPVTQGATATIPTVDALEMTGTTLDDLAGTTAGAGWEHTWFLIYGENSEWRVYPSAATVTNRRLPHLPSGYSQTVFGELTGAAAWLIKNGSTDPLWRRDHVVAWTYAFWYRDL
jgi:hypothetical protein